MRYYNPSNKSWDVNPFMVKEYSVFLDGYIATVVVVPFEKTNKKGEIETGFVKMGVRIESAGTRVTGKGQLWDYQIPGRSYFYKLKTGYVSETEQSRTKLDRCGVVFENGSPVMLPGEKTKGVPLEEHRLFKKLAGLIGEALAAHAAYMMEKRAA